MTKALSVFLVLFVATPAIAQDSVDVVSTSTAAQERPYRDPHKARTLATILPGAGYIYTGEYFRGYGTWVATASSFIWAPYEYEYGSCAFSSIDKCTRGALRWESRAMGVFFVGTGLWTWIASVRDAPLAAERANERHRRRELKVGPLLEIKPQSQQQLRAGLSLDW